MIVGPPSVIAMAPPTADLAMLDGFRVDIKDVGSGDGALDTASDVPVVRGIVGNAVFLGRVVRSGSHDESRLRFELLGFGKQIGIQGYL